MNQALSLIKIIGVSLSRKRSPDVLSCAVSALTLTTIYHINGVKKEPVTESRLAVGESPERVVS